MWRSCAQMEARGAYMAEIREKAAGEEDEAGAEKKDRERRQR
jgi:hypothetical protein